MIKKFVPICLTLFNVIAFAQNMSVTFGFPEVTTSTGNTDPSNMPLVNGLTFSPFTAQGVSANPSASGRFSFTGWPVGASDGDDNYGHYSASLGATQYYEFALTVKPGFTLDLHSLQFDARRSGTGIRVYCVRTSLDNFSTNLSATVNANTNLEIIPSDIFFWKYDSLTGSKDQKGSRIVFDQRFSYLTDTTLSFRFYAWNAESGGGSFSVDNVNLIGTLRDSSLLSGLTQHTDMRHIRSCWTLRTLHNEKHTYVLRGPCYLNAMKVIGLDGRQLFVPLHRTSEEEWQFNLPQKTSGIYLLILETEEAVYYLKCLAE